LRGARGTSRVAQRLVGSEVLLRRRTAAVGVLPPLGLVLVYRNRNAVTVEQLLQQAGPQVRIALWALDEVAPALASLTVGQGPGPRCALLNRCAELLGLPADGWLVLADDDVTMVRGTLPDLLRVAIFAGLDVCQPTHASDSTCSWEINEHHPMTLVRTSRFVETGPLVLMSPKARAACLPLPEAFAMGIGVEAVWGGRLELRTALVDALTMRHLGRVGETYDLFAEWDRNEPLVRELLRPAGMETVRDLQHVGHRWFPWRRHPLWMRSTPLAPGAG